MKKELAERKKERKKIKYSKRRNLKKKNTRKITK